MRTTSNGNIVYSVDMLLAYINIFTPVAKKVNMKDIKYDTSIKGWGEKNISVDDVLKNPKKYKDDYNRIEEANLKYPIIMDKSGNILDGVHRFIKSKMQNKRYIKVYEIENTLLKKFIIDRKGNYNVRLDINEYIELFYKRFLSELGV